MNHIEFTHDASELSYYIYIYIYTNYILIWSPINSISFQFEYDD